MSLASGAYSYAHHDIQGADGKTAGIFSLERLKAGGIAAGTGFVAPFMGSAVGRVGQIGAKAEVVAGQIPMSLARSGVSFLGQTTANMGLSYGITTFSGGQFTFDNVVQSLLVAGASSVNRAQNRPLQQKLDTLKSALRDGSLTPDQLRAMAKDSNARVANLQNELAVVK
jgi:hypothetical protein